MAEEDKEIKQDFPGQHEDEEVEFIFRQHPIVLRRTLLLSLVVFAVGAIPFNVAPTWSPSLWMLGGGLVLAFFIVLYRWIGWYYSVYIATSERLIQIKQHGFFDRRVVDITLENTQGINYEIKGVQATMFHFGTIILKTFVGDIILDYIRHPADVQRRLLKIIKTLQPGEGQKVEPAETEEE